MKRSLFSIVLLAAVCRAADPVAKEPSASGSDRVSAIHAAWEAGDHKGASADVKRWMKKEQKSPWPWVAGADLEFQQKHYRSCISMADGALKRDPNSADGYFWRGRCLESRGKTLEAANEYGAALEAQPAHLAALEGRNRTRTALGETTAEDRPN